MQVFCEERPGARKIILGILLLAIDKSKTAAIIYNSRYITAII